MNQAHYYRGQDNGAWILPTSIAVSLLNIIKYELTSAWHQTVRGE